MRLAAVPRRGGAHRRLLRQADPAEGRPRAARCAPGRRRARRGRRLRPRARLRSSGRPPSSGVAALFTGPLEHRHLRHLLALADACVVPSVFPEAFGMVAAEAAAAGCPPLVARHSGLAEVAAGLEEAYPAGAGDTSTSFPTGDAGCAARAGCASCSGCRLRIAPRCGPPPAPPPSSGGAGRGSRGAAGSRRSLTARIGRRTSAGAASTGHVAPTMSRFMGDAQRVPYDQLLREARERFEAADDFTVAVEEEFALLDPGHARPRQPLRGRGRGGAWAPRWSATSPAS